MTIDVGKTVDLQEQLLEELTTLQKRRFMGRRKIVRLCLFLLQLLAHLNELSKGLLALYRQLERFPTLEESVEEGSEHEG